MRLRLERPALMAVLLAASLLLGLLFPPLSSLQSSDPVEETGIGTPQEETPFEGSAEKIPEPGVSGVSDPHDYLYASYPRVARRLDCVIARESNWHAWEVNPRSGASGLAQFILSTWLSTPQGKAGASRTNPFASIDGAVYLIEQTSKSWRHWDVVSLGLC